MGKLELARGIFVHATMIFCLLKNFWRDEESWWIVSAFDETWNLDVESSRSVISLSFAHCITRGILKFFVDIVFSFFRIAFRDGNTKPLMTSMMALYGEMAK